MTEPIEWLVATQGLGGLHPDELEAIRDFTLLWGLFEGKAMATEGSPSKVVAATERMQLPDPLPPGMTGALAFWRDRYWQQGAVTPAFDALRFRANVYRTLTADVLSGARHDRRDIVKALLLVILRLRNNLFHGVKWQYLLNGQLHNFTHANRVLMSAIDLAVPPP